MSEPQKLLLASVSEGEAGDTFDCDLIVVPLTQQLVAIWDDLLSACNVSVDLASQAKIGCGRLLHLELFWSDFTAYRAADVMTVDDKGNACDAFTAMGNAGYCLRDASEVTLTGDEQRIHIQTVRLVRTGDVEFTFEPKHTELTLESTYVSLRALVEAFEDDDA